MSTPPYVTFDMFDKVWIVVPQNAGPGLLSQPVVQFSPGLPVSAGTIVLPALSPLPNAFSIGSQWLPPSGWWVAVEDFNLPNSQPPFDSGVDGLQWSAGYSLPPSG